MILLAFVAGYVTAWLVHHVTGRITRRWLFDSFRRDRLRLPR
jgi:hypothetical protein